MGLHQAGQNSCQVHDCVLRGVNFYDPDNNLIFVFVYLAKPIAPEPKQTPGSGTALNKRLILILQKTFAGKA
jgi:hypothetical protein